MTRLCIHSQQSSSSRCQDSFLYLGCRILCFGFEFDSYSVYEKKVYDSNDDFKNIYKRVYFCYFDEKQKKIFNQFLNYYRNLIMHGKLSLVVEFINNTAVITIQYEMY